MALRRLATATIGATVQTFQATPGAIQTCRGKASKGETRNTVLILGTFPFSASPLWTRPSARAGGAQLRRV
jgi:hypothetical protein